jgi:hypothetical protein
MSLYLCNASDQLIPVLKLPYEIILTTCLLLQLPELTERDNLHSPLLQHLPIPDQSLAAQGDGSGTKQFAQR